MTAQAGFDVLSKTIERGLAKNRDSIPRGLNNLPVFKVPIYVVSMCESLLRVVHKSGASHVTLKDLVRLESACTGADYQHKLALRCHRLVLDAAA